MDDLIPFESYERAAGVQNPRRGGPVEPAIFFLVLILVGTSGLPAFVAAYGLAPGWLLSVGIVILLSAAWLRSTSPLIATSLWDKLKQYKAGELQLRDHTLEDAFGWRMVCYYLPPHFFDRPIPGVMYLDSASVAFVPEYRPIWHLVWPPAVLRFSLKGADVTVAPRIEFSAPQKALRFRADGRLWDFLTPDADAAVERIRVLMSAHVT